MKFNSRLDDESDHSNDVHDIRNNQRAQNFSVSTYVLIDDSVIDAITLLQDDNIRLNATKENIDNNSRNINDLYKLFIYTRKPSQRGSISNHYRRQLTMCRRETFTVFN